MVGLKLSPCSLIHKTDSHVNQTSNCPYNLDFNPTYEQAKALDHIHYLEKSNWTKANLLIVTPICVTAYIVQCKRLERIL